MKSWRLGDSNLLAGKGQGIFRGPEETLSKDIENKSNWYKKRQVREGTTKMRTTKKGTPMESLARLEYTKKVALENRTVMFSQKKTNLQNKNHLCFRMDNL